MIIGTFAYCGSGQDTLADSFCKLYGFKKYSLGDVVREIAFNRGLKSTREVLQNIRKECDAEYGRFYIPNKIIEWIQVDNCYDIIITGIRTLEEYEIFTANFGMKLIFVYADQVIRMKRMLQRNSERDSKSISLLKRDMEEENAMFDYKKLEKLSDYKFDFNMDLSDYKKKEVQIVDGIIQKIGGRFNG